MQTGQVKVYVRSMGKMLRVTAIAADKDSANRWLAIHRDDGVVAELPGGTVLIADRYDPGEESE